MCSSLEFILWVKEDTQTFTIEKVLRKQSTKYACLKKYKKDDPQCYENHLLNCNAVYTLKSYQKYTSITIGHPKVWSLDPYKLGIVYKTSNYKSIQVFFAPNFWTMIWSFCSLSGLKLGVKAQEYSYNLDFL
jgi:hypothetical protein